MATDYLSTSNLFQITRIDSQNAILYATFHADVLRHKLYSEKLPHIFGHAVPKIEILKVQPTNIAKDLLLMSFKLHMRTEKTCNQISCFNNLPNKFQCQKDTPTRRIMMGDETSIITCQPACRLHEDKNSYNLLWNGQSCMIDPHQLVYMYAMDPKLRAEKPTKGVTNLKRGFDIYDYDPATKFMHVNKSYCNHFERNYDAKTKSCYRNPLDWILSEQLVGDTVVTFFKKVIKNDDLVATVNIATEIIEDTRTPLPDNLINRDAWLNFKPQSSSADTTDEYTPGDWKKKFEEFGKKVKEFDYLIILTGLLSFENIKDTLINMGISIGLDVLKKFSKVLISKFLNSSIFRGLVNATTSVPIALFKNALGGALVMYVVKNLAGSAVKLLKTVWKFTKSVVNFLLLVTTIISLILDTWDPYDLRKISDKAMLYEFSLQLRSNFRNEFEKNNVARLLDEEFDVRYLYQFYNNADTQVFPEIERKVETVFWDRYYEYLYKLKINSSGQDLSPIRNSEMIHLNVNESIETLNIASLITKWDSDFDDEYLSNSQRYRTQEVTLTIISIPLLIFSLIKQKLQLFYALLFLSFAMNFFIRYRIDNLNLSDFDYI